MRNILFFEAQNILRRVKRIFETKKFDTYSNTNAVPLSLPHSHINVYRDNISRRLKTIVWHTVENVYYIQEDTFFLFQCVIRFSVQFSVILLRCTEKKNFLILLVSQNRFCAVTSFCKISHEKYLLGFNSFKREVSSFEHITFFMHIDS